MQIDRGTVVSRSNSIITHDLYFFNPIFQGLLMFFVIKSLKFLPLCWVSIQKQFVIASILWCREYSIHIQKFDAHKLPSFKYIHHTCAIITPGLYTFYPIFQGQKRFFGAFFVKFWPYVRLVFKSGFKSRACYSCVPTVPIF